MDNQKPGPLGTLLAEVLARPDDDAPREAYARAIQAADPERAEFIRVQFALAEAQLVRGTAKHRELRKAEEDLLHRRASDWVGDLGPWVRIIEVNATPLPFVRGFLEQLAMTAEDFLSHGPSLCRRIPFRHLDLIGPMSHDLAIRLLLGPELSCLRSLRIEDAEVTTEWMVALADSPHVARLQWLRWKHGTIGNAGILALAGSTHLPALRYCRLADPAEDPRLRYQDEMGKPVMVETPYVLGRLERCYGPIPWLHPVFVDDYRFTHKYRRLLGPEHHQTV